MLRRSTAFWFDTKRVGASMGMATRAGCVKSKCVACERDASGVVADDAVSADVVGMMLLADAMDCRSSSKGSRSVEAIAFDQRTKTRLGTKPRGVGVVGLV